MASGADTARSLAEKYLARIEALDRQGPALRAVLEINPDALAIADGLDAERKAGKVRGPLHGIPVLIKDNIGTADRMNDDGGLARARGRDPRRGRASSSKRLRDAGAVILGKTNLSEWANFRSTHSSSGWSGRGGQCRNPYALDRNPSGSSSGSGAAAAANLCAVGGRHRDGRLDRLALEQLRPRRHQADARPRLARRHHPDRAQPGHGRADDAAPSPTPRSCSTALAGFDPADPATKDASRARRRATTRRSSIRRASQGARIGVPRKKLFGQSPAADRARRGGDRRHEAAGRRHRGSGRHRDGSARSDDSEFEVLLYEFKADLNAYLAALGAGDAVPDAEGPDPFNEENRDREMPYFGQEIFEKAEAKGPLTDKAYVDALEKDLRLSRKEGIDKTMDEHKLDALVAPTSGPATLIDLVNGDYGAGGSSSLPGGRRLSATSPCRAGYAFGLPVGHVVLRPRLERADAA